MIKRNLLSRCLKFLGIPDVSLDPVRLPLLSDQELNELRRRTIGRVTMEYRPPRVVEHTMLGEHQSLHRGSGIDYEESRLYQYGDNIRHIHWSLSARTGKTYVKTYREERRPEMIVLLDRRSAMRFGTKRRLKVTQAVRVASGVVVSANFHDIPTACVLLDASVQWHAATLPAAGIEQQLELFRRSCPPLALNNVSPSINSAIHLIATKAKRGDHIVILSDCIDANEETTKCLLELTQNQRHCAVVRIFDPYEVDLTENGLIQMCSAVDSTPVFCDTTENEFREKYRRKMQDLHTNTETRIKASGAVVYSLDSATDDIDSLVSELTH